MFKLEFYFIFQKWFTDNMGQVDSKRPMPSIHVQSPHTAHLPEKSRTPTTPVKALLDIPHHRVRRKSVDTAFEEISKSFEFERNNTPPDQSTDKRKDSGGLLKPSGWFPCEKKLKKL